jgi:hypothetical protein
MIECKTCLEHKDESAFYVRTSGRLWKSCKKCSSLACRARESKDPERNKAYHKVKSREWYLKTKAENPEILLARSAARANCRRDSKSLWVKKFGSICEHCKQTYPDPVFEFHHLNPKDKDTTPAKLFMYKQTTIAAELAKCIMLCANCHRIEHAKQ